MTLSKNLYAKIKIDLLRLKIANILKIPESLVEDSSQNHPTTSKDVILGNTRDRPVYNAFSIAGIKCKCK